MTVYAVWYIKNVYIQHRLQKYHFQYHSQRQINWYQLLLTLNFKTYCNSKPLQLPPIPPHSSAFTQVYPLCGACSSCYQSCHTLLFTNFSRTWTILKIYHLHILFLVLVLILILKADGNLFEVRDPISHWKVHSPWQTCWLYICCVLYIGRALHRKDWKEIK